MNTALPIQAALSVRQPTDLQANQHQKAAPDGNSPEHKEKSNAPLCHQLSTTSLQATSQTPSYWLSERLPHVKNKISLQEDDDNLNNRNILNDNAIHAAWHSLEMNSLKSGHNCLNFDAKRDRFFNMRIALDTCAQKIFGLNLNANVISIKSEPIAVACQFPKSHQIHQHLLLLKKIISPVVVILASSNEVSFFYDLPPYFMENSTYHDLEVTCKKQPNDTKAPMLIKKFELCIQRKNKNTLFTKVFKSNNYDKTKITVLQVEEWPISCFISIKKLRYLATLVNNYTNDFSTYGLPVIHCQSGISRTAQLLAMMAMLKYKDQDVSLERIVSDIRASRSFRMVRYYEQFNHLAACAQACGISIANKPCSDNML